MFLLKNGAFYLRVKVQLSALNNHTALVAIRLTSIYDLELTKPQIEYFLKTHPDFPSLKCMTDLLTGLGIEHAAVKVKSDQLAEAEVPFMAYLKVDGQKQLTLIEQQTAQHRVMFDGVRKKISKSKFDKQFTGIALLLGKKLHPNSIDVPKLSDRKSEKTIITTAMLVVLLGIPGLLGAYNGFSGLQGFSGIAWLISKLLGLSVATMLVLKHMNEGLAERICNAGSKIDCNSVLSSPYSKFLGLVKWSDLGLLYFYTSLNLLMAGIELRPLLGFLALSAALYIPISIYQQAIRIRKWCVFCLAVLGLLFIEAALAVNGLAGFSIPPISQMLLPITLTATGSFGLIMTRMLYRSQEEKRMLSEQYSRMKNDPDVFTTLVEKSQFVDTRNNIGGLQFGQNVKGVVQVTMFLNLGCPHCSEAFEKLYHHTKSNTALNWRLVLIPGAEQEITVLVRTYEYYKKSPAEALEYLSNWYKKTHQSHKKAIDKDKELSLKILKDNTELMRAFQAREFPAIYVENFKMTKHYELEDYLKFSNTVRQLAETRHSKRNDHLIHSTSTT